MAEASQVGAPGAPPLSRPTFNLSRGHYIVTGACQGLGREIACQLKGVGAARLALLSLDADSGDKVVAELTDESCLVRFFQVDLSDPEALKVACEGSIEFLGRVDGLVNAAGTTQRGNVFTTTVEGFDKIFDINTRAPFLLTQILAAHWIKSETRGGAIVNISSLCSKGGAPFLSAYAGSKAAQNILTMNTAAELALHGIRVNGINMGWTVTDNEHVLMAAAGGQDWLKGADEGHPMKRLLRPVDIACTVCFLLSPAARMMTGNVLDQHPGFATQMLSRNTEDGVGR